MDHDSHHSGKGHQDRSCVLSPPRTADIRPPIATYRPVSPIKGNRASSIRNPCDRIKAEGEHHRTKSKYHHSL